jgi:hypothetical protein
VQAIPWPTTLTAAMVHYMARGAKNIEAKVPGTGWPRVLKVLSSLPYSTLKAHLAER